MAEDSSFSMERALRQVLEGWRRAGLSHLPFPPRARERSAAASSMGNPPPVVPRATSSRDALRRPVQEEEESVPRRSSPSPVKETPSLPIVSEPLPGSPHPAGSRADREWRLKVWKERVAKCVRCRELATHRTQTVFGVGNPEARILFIGEAPGADEDLQGEPFVGAAGQLLDKIIAACGLKREELYICNILRCRPPGNRKPLPEEAANCREFLEAQLNIVDPEFIICLGATAAQNLMNTTDSIGRLRGRLFQHGRAKVLCTYHPSYLLRNPAAKKDVWEDMKFFLRAAGLPIPS
jgi:DNA polymerase